MVPLPTYTRGATRPHILKGGAMAQKITVNGLPFKVTEFRDCGGKLLNMYRIELSTSLYGARVSVDSDGYIHSLRNESPIKGLGSLLVLLAVKYGGETIGADNWDLAHKVYKPLGFEVVSCRYAQPHLRLDKKRKREIIGLWKSINMP